MKINSVNRKMAFLLSILLLCTLTFLPGCFSVQNYTGPLGHLAKLQIGTSGRISSAKPERSSNRDMIFIPPGEKFVLADIKGNGSIRHIWITFPAPDSSWLCKNGCSTNNQLVLRMYWDGNSNAAVETPLGDFFASGFGQRTSINSLPIMVSPGLHGESYNSYWIMPFNESAIIEIENQGTCSSGSFYYQIDYQLNEKNSKETPYFCAQYNQEFPCKSGRDYVILEAEGSGHYVGTVLSGRSRSPVWFGEGDEKFYIDGDIKPTIQGTGTEDFALHAWGFKNPTSFSYCGVPILFGEYRMVGWKMTLYRWHIVEPVSFTKSLRVEIENAGWITEDELAEGVKPSFVERNDDYSSVAFWYQTGQPKRFTNLPSALDRELPNIDIVYKSTDILGKTIASDQGAIKLQGSRDGKGFQWTEGKQLLFYPSHTENTRAWIQSEFSVDAEELRQLTLRVSKADDYGIYRILLDDVVLRDRYDFYSQNLEITEINLGQYKLQVGAHLIRFECLGKSDSSKGFNLGFDSIRLRERFEVKRTTPTDLY